MFGVFCRVPNGSILASLPRLDRLRGFAQKRSWTLGYTNASCALLVTSSLSPIAASTTGDIQPNSALTAGHPAQLRLSLPVDSEPIIIAVERADTPTSTEVHLTDLNMAVGDIADLRASATTIMDNTLKHSFFNLFYVGGRNRLCEAL
jgi:hypothetical protein